MDGWMEKEEEVGLGDEGIQILTLIQTHYHFRTHTHLCITIFQIDSGLSLGAGF